MEAADSQAGKVSATRSVRIVFTQGALLGAAVAALHLGWAICPGVAGLPPARDRVQPLALLLLLHVALCWVLLAGLRAVWSLRGKAVQVSTRARPWRDWYVWPLAGLLAWLAVLNWYQGPMPSWPDAFGDDAAFRLAECAILFPVCALLGWVLAWACTSRWAGGAMGLAAACMVVLGGVLGNVVPMRSNASPEARTHNADGADGLRRVVLVAIDALRADSLSCMGSKRVATPAIDAVAKQGVLFTRAISQAPWTVPSVASILTGRYPSVHGAGRVDKELDAFKNAVRDGLSKDVMTIAEMLRDAGWTCGGFVTNAILDPSFGFGKGFQHYMTPAQLRPRLEVGDNMSPGDVWRLKLLRAARWETIFRKRVDCESYFDRLAVDRAAEWMKARADERVFAFVHLFAPHEYAVYAPRTDDGRALSRESRQTIHAQDIRAVAVADNTDIQTGDLAVLRDRYDTNAMFADVMFESLVRKLKAANLWRDTLVIVTSDHGEEFEEHGGRGHGHSMFDELLHVPLIVACPGRLPRGVVVADQVRLIDVVPTILELAGVDQPVRLNGRSLTELLSAGAAPERIAYSEFDERQALEAVRTASYTLIVRRADGKAEVLPPGSGDGVAADLRVLHQTWREDMAQQQKGIRRFIPEINFDLLQQLHAMGYMKD